MKILNNTKYLLVAFFLFTGFVSFGQATVDIEVNWPQWSSENRVRLYDSSNTLLASVCNPAACFNGSGSSSYSTTSSFSIPYGTGYYILLEDTWGDGWNGTGSYVRVSVNGVLTLENDGKEVSVNGLNGLYNDQLPRTLTFDITTNPTAFNTDLAIYDEFPGYSNYTTAGGTLRTQPNSPGNGCAVTTTSSGTLTSSIPPTATIEKAYLYWASSGIAADANVTLDGQPVMADQTYRSYSKINQGYFTGGLADVTAIAQASVSGTFNFAGLTIDSSLQYCSVETVLGGWAIMVFYSEPSLPASSVVLYAGFKGDSGANYASGVATSTFGLSGFYAIGSAGSKTSTLSWEGDQTLANNESLTFTTPSAGTNKLVGDGDNNGTTVDNPFNSTIFDSSALPIVNNTTAYGMDLDTYDVSSFINPAETSATTTVNVGQDFVIMNAVVLKVPSNLITGYVFEDVNYGGGSGRSLVASGGLPVEGATVELYDNTGTLMQTTTTDASGYYLFGGMINGTHRVRVVSFSVSSTRTGGSTCSSCVPVQTFKTNYSSSTLVSVTNEVGGADPATQDVVVGTVIGAQSIATVTIANEGAVGVDFGFSFNTIVNTNEDGQGSLEQFIVNSNNLDETNLDIEANSIFDPASGVDTSVFMIPSSVDPLGRVADANFANGYFDISIPNANPLTAITDSNTIIDGRTQTAYSGDTNAGAIGSGGSTVGVSAAALPNYDLPEIQVYRNDGDVFKVQGSITVIRDISVYSNDNAGIRVDSGSVTLANNLLGVNAQGSNAGNIDYGVEITNGSMVVDGNYITTNSDAGILINGGTSTIIQNNHITDNGNTACFDNITIQGGSGIVIQQNLIDNAASLGIDGDGISGNITISENTIMNSGQNGGACSGNLENAGILLDGNNSTISNNIIASNEGSGIVLAGGNSSGNLISQNSIYANGTSTDALGIDLDQADGLGDGVTINDNGDSDNGPNAAINFPVISVAYISGTSLVVKGWARPGATIEVFLTDVNEGSATEGDNQLGMLTDYGEGQTYIGTIVEGSVSDLDSGISSYADVDGNSDNTNQFEFNIPLLGGMGLGDYITATATISNSTSEFSPFSILKVGTVITNRRITYRVSPN